MTGPNNLFRLRTQIAWLDDWQANLEQTIADAEQEMDVVQRLREVAIEARDKLLSKSATGTRRRITLDDIKHCKTQREVLRLVAELNGGPAHLGDVAELVVDARMTKADKDSVRSTLYHFVTDNPDDWAHMGNGRVWLLEFGPVPNTGDLEDDEAADQVEPSDEDSGDANTIGPAPAGESAPVSVSCQEAM